MKNPTVHFAWAVFFFLKRKVHKPDKKRRTRDGKIIIYFRVGN